MELLIVNIRKTILKLIRQVNKIETESGNNELYIAYPFVQGLVKKEDVYALFENDLPDTYNE